MFSCSKRPRIRIVRRSSSNSQSRNAEAIANNYDLLIQILVCLPVKSLVRFKSVSKAWHSLISDSNFSHRLFPHISGLIIQKFPIDHKVEYDFIPLSHNSTVTPFKFLDFTYHPLGLQILQSCNGLLLCDSLSKPCRYFRQKSLAYYVYNPTTKQLVMLPPRATNQNTLRVFAINLAFDPIKSPHYKVVCVREPDPRLDVQKYPHPRLDVIVDQDDPQIEYRCGQIDIYSSKTKSWRISRKRFLANLSIEFSTGKFCNGAIHWLSGRGTTSLYFNVEEEKLRKMPMPPYPDDWEYWRRYVYFGESGGHLQLIEIYKPPDTQFNVYEIESDYSGWFVKYRIDLDPLTVAFPEMIRTYSDPSELNYYAFSVFGIVMEANEEESYMVLQIPEKAIQYNLKDGSFKKICDLDPYEDDYKCSPPLIYLTYKWAAMPFMQTLCSI